MPSTVPALLLTQNCEVKPTKVTLQSEDQGCQLADIQKYLKRKTLPTLLGTYPWKGQTLHLLGYKDGKAGTENQHELPPPHDKDLYFGDIVLLLTKEKKSFAKPVVMKSDEYENFYTQMFEGFEDLGDSDSDDDDEFEEEEEADELEEGEFEENEGPSEFLEEVEDHEIVEEFEVVGKKEEDEDDHIPVVIKKKPAAKTASSKGKSKALKEHSTIQLVAAVELESEKNIPTTVSDQLNRANTVTIIQKLLGSILVESRCIELEHHIYNASLQIAAKKHVTKTWTQSLFIDLYSAVARSVIGNLNPNSYIQNKDLYTRFSQGKITLEEITSFTFSDLYPEIWKDLSIRQFEREKRLLEGNKSMATDQFECKRCHKRECTYYELQTRSADEPMTIFIQCVNCGKHWRQ